jgi:hypothetical protein
MSKRQTTDYYDFYRDELIEAAKPTKVERQYVEQLRKAAAK